MTWIPVAEPNLSGRERRYVMDCLKSGWISSKGKYVELFEKAFARRVGAKHGVALCNGTAAVHLTLLVAGVTSGDEVIVPTLTYIATANAIAYTGARPVFVDCDVTTWNMDPDKVAAAVTSRTRAILAVHLYGYPCDMDALRKIARRHRLVLIEDAAEAIGSRYKGRPAGSLGDMAAFSFFGNKTITTGEGGMLVTNDASLAARARLLAGQAMSPTRYYFFETIGYNYRMTNIQAAIGLGQVEKLQDHINCKLHIASEYTRLLQTVDGLTLPPTHGPVLNSHWMYSVLVEKTFGIGRDELITRLREQGIETRRFFYPCHTMPAFKQPRERHPVAQRLSDRGINLPSSTKLTDRQIRTVVAAIKSAAR